MSDIPKPKHDKELAVPTGVKPAYPPRFGHAVLSTSGLIEPKLEYISERSHHRPSFYEVEKGRRTDLVDMDDKGKVTVAQGEEKRIATFGLSGCTAVAVAVEKADGSRTGYIQHYSPLNSSLGLHTLAEELKGVGENVVSARAVVMTPGEWTQDPSAKWAMKPRDEQLADFLTDISRIGLGEDADIQVRPYSENQEAGRYGQGTLMVELKADGETLISADMLLVRPEA